MSQVKAVSMGKKLVPRYKHNCFGSEIIQMTRLFGACVYSILIANELNIFSINLFGHLFNPPVQPHGGVGNTAHARVGDLFSTELSSRTVENVSFLWQLFTTSKPPAEKSTRFSKSTH